MTATARWVRRGQQDPASSKTSLLEYFASQGLFNEPTAFDGRSSTVRSSPLGSPPAAVHRRRAAEDCGAGRQYGGIVDAQLDPCYRRVRHVRRHRHRSWFHGTRSRLGCARSDVRRRRSRGPVLLEDQARRQKHAELTDPRANLVAAADGPRAAGGCGDCAGRQVETLCDRGPVNRRGEVSVRSAWVSGSTGRVPRADPSRQGLQAGVEPVGGDRDGGLSVSLVWREDVVDVVGALDDAKRLVRCVQGGDERR